MREIGGYIELDTYHLPMLHENAIALNCGRNALAYLIRARGISKLRIPRLICDSIMEVCIREGIEYSFYSIGMDFLPAEEMILGEGEWLYFVNYYSQHDNETIAQYIKKYHRVIVDNAQSYFQKPIPGTDTIYTCRKYFGVADGAFLYTDTFLEEKLQQDESYNRMGFLLGRFERTATEFYQEYDQNNNFFNTEPIKRMSKLTANLLHGIEYSRVKQRRIDNFLYLHNALSDVNQLCIKCADFMYPLMIKDGELARKRLHAKKIYIPTLWPSVCRYASSIDIEYQMVQKILPLPIDQRYDSSDMQYIVGKIKEAMS